MFKWMKLFTDSLYLALAEKELCDCIRSEKRQEFELLSSEDCIVLLTADAYSNFFPRICCANHKKHDKKEPGLFKVEFRCAKMLCLCSKTYSYYDSLSNRYKFSCEGLNKQRFEGRGDGPLAKYRKVLSKMKNVSATNLGFRTKNPREATYEQTRTWLNK